MGPPSLVSVDMEWCYKTGFQYSCLFISRVKRALLTFDATVVVFYFAHTGPHGILMLLLDSRGRKWLIKNFKLKSNLNSNLNL